MHTVIAICTYRRPNGLNRLLNHIAQLELPGGFPDRDLAVVVVDNHADAQGLQVCEKRAPDYRFALHATSKAGNGISEARNQAVLMALKAAPNFVGFLDDDEWPSPDWLREILRVLESTQADAAGGPTRPVFPEDAPTELLEVPYYGADMALVDGARCTLQAAGNFVIRSKCLIEAAPHFFHPDFAMSGGEDLAFFTKMSQRGVSMVWASQAIVMEEVPPSRLSKEWLKTRVINIANSRVRVMQMLEPGKIPAAIRVIKTAGLGVQAGVFTAIGLIVKNFQLDAALLRWKFIGKFRAHRDQFTERPEGH